MSSMRGLEGEIRRAFARELEDVGRSKAFASRLAWDLRSGRAPASPAAPLSPRWASALALGLAGLVVAVVLGPVATHRFGRLAGPAPHEFAISGSPSARFDSALVWDPARTEYLLLGGIGTTGGGQLGETWTFDGRTWVNRHPRHQPSNPGASPWLVAYDATRSQVVAYGDLSTACSHPDTWTWDGSDWTEHPGPGPSRVGGMMAYVPDLGSMVVWTFGGCGGGPLETWAWDGGAWHPIEASGAPSPSFIHGSMAYDPSQEALVFLGVIGDGSSRSWERWRFDGHVWKQLALPSSGAPTIRTDAAIAFLGGGRWLVYGGRTQGRVMDDTWLLQPTGWMKVQAPGPPARWGASLSVDPNPHQALLFGGRSQEAGGTALSDTWLWDGRAWLRGVESRITPTPSTDPRPSPAPSLPPVSAPPPRTDQGMVWDPTHHQVVMIGGSTRGSQGGAALSDTWLFDGQHWQAAHPATPLPPGRDWLTAYDQTHQQVVAVGSAPWDPLSGAPPCVDHSTWTWNGANWTEHSGHAPQPSGVMAYDPALGRVVLVGGGGCGGDYGGETWTWDGASWTQLHPGGTALPAPALGAMAYDAASRSLLFLVTEGGITGRVPMGLWRFDGSAWSQVPLVGPQTPPSRRDSVVVPLEAGRWLVFSGLPSGGPLPLEGGTLNDAWLLDGTRWTQLHTAVMPSARSSSAAAYDPDQREVVMFGGQNGIYGPDVMDDTWTWDGSTWQQVG